MFFKLRVKKKKNSSIYIPARSNILFCDYITLTVSGVYRISGGGGVEPLRLFYYIKFSLILISRYHDSFTKINFSRRLNPRNRPLDTPLFMERARSSGRGVGRLKIHKTRVGKKQKKSARKRF